MKQSQRSLILWLLIVTLIIVAYKAIGNHRGNVEKIDYSTFVREIPQVAEVEINANTITGTYRNDGMRFHTVGPIGENLLDKLVSAGVEVKFDREEQVSMWQSLLITWLPMLFLVGLFIFFMRQIQGGGGKAMSFGKSKAKLVPEDAHKVTFKNVAGLDEAKEELMEVIEFLKDPKKFTKLGGKIPKGVLLMGPPGTGKTLLAKAVAGEAGVPFFTISGSDFVEMFVGVGASRVRDLFEQGKKSSPCIIFIDEIDAVGRHRGAGLGGGHDEREQTLNQLLVEMDGFEGNSGVIIMAGTNRPDVLDPALLRPGRFDRRVVVGKPDLRGRIGILQVHTSRVPLSADVELELLARGTPGFSGADLANLVNEAALLAARADKKNVSMADFEAAKDKVMMGVEKKTSIMSEKEIRTTAWHEAGHALVAKLMPEADPVHKVTIIPRGMALGLTQQLPKEDSYSLTKSKALTNIRIFMGGRAAEELVFQHFTTGAGNDIERATELARRMICEWGMSDVMGPVAFGKGDGEVFLGREMAKSQAYSQETAIAIDNEIKDILNKAYNEVCEMLKENRDKLDLIAENLLEYETLDYEDLGLLMDGQAVKKEKPTVKKVISREENDRKKDDSDLDLGTDPDPNPVG